MSTSYHPQTDGQTEQINRLLEEYLRHYVRSDQSDRVDLLDAAQFNYNMQRSFATGFNPFELATGRQPLAPHTMSKGFYGPSPYAMMFMK